MTKTTAKKQTTKLIANSTRSLICSNLGALFAGLALGVLVTRILPADDANVGMLIAYVFLPFSIGFTMLGNHFRKKDTASANEKRRAKRSGNR